MYGHLRFQVTMSRLYINIKFFCRQNQMTMEFFKIPIGIPVRKVVNQLRLLPHQCKRDALNLIRNLKISLSLNLFFDPHVLYKGFHSMTKTHLFSSYIPTYFVQHNVMQIFVLQESCNILPNKSTVATTLEVL